MERGIVYRSYDCGDPCCFSKGSVSIVLFGLRRVCRPDCVSHLQSVSKALDVGLDLSDSSQVETGGSRSITYGSLYIVIRVCGVVLYLRKILCQFIDGLAF